MFLVAGLAVAGLVGIAAAFYFSIRSGNRGDKRLRSAGAGRAGTGRRPGSRSGGTRDPAGPQRPPGRWRRHRAGSRPGFQATRCSSAAEAAQVGQVRRVTGRHARWRPAGWRADQGAGRARRLGDRPQPPEDPWPGDAEADDSWPDDSWPADPAATDPRLSVAEPRGPGAGRLQAGQPVGGTPFPRSPCGRTRPGRPSRAAAWASAREPTSTRSCGRRRRSAASATSSSGTTWRRTSRSPRPRVPPSRTRDQEAGCRGQVWRTDLQAQAPAATLPGARRPEARRPARTAVATALPAGDRNRE